MFLVARLALFAGLVVAPGLHATAQEQPPVRSEHFAKVDFKAEDGTSLVYYLMTPADPEPGRKYPIVLALHGRGGNTQAAGTLASDAMRKQYPCFIIAPVASRDFRWAVPESSKLGNRLGSKDKLPAVLEALDDVLAKHSVDADRVYVTGQSMGGFGTFGAIAARPKFFAAAVPICGGWDPKEATTFAGVPLWAFHGTKDTTVAPKLTTDVIDALVRAGGEPAPKLTLYEGVGHNSWSRTYESPETWKWMFAQKRKPATDAAPDRGE